MSQNRRCKIHKSITSNCRSRRESHNFINTFEILNHSGLSLPFKRQRKSEKKVRKTFQNLSKASSLRQENCTKPNFDNKLILTITFQCLYIFDYDCNPTKNGNYL